MPQGWSPASVSQWAIEAQRPELKSPCAADQAQPEAVADQERPAGEREREAQDRRTPAGAGRGRGGVEVSRCSTAKIASVSSAVRVAVRNTMDSDMPPRASVAEPGARAQLCPSRATATIRWIRLRLLCMTTEPVGS